MLALGGARRLLLRPLCSAPASRFLASRSREPQSMEVKERRFALDGKAYTWQEFKAYYGSGTSDSDGVAYEHWDAARHLTHQLTKEITRQVHIDEVLTLRSKYAQGMDDIHIATCWTTVGRLASKRMRERAWLRYNVTEMQPLREHTGVGEYTLHWAREALDTTHP